MSLPPLLLLPGMMLDGRVFAAQRALLEPLTAVAVGDLTNGDSIEQIAGQVLDAAPPRFALAGLSMGGIVALDIWRRAPHRVTHLALLDTTAQADRPDRTQVRRDQVEAVAQGHLRDVLVQSLKPQYLAARHRADQALLTAILDMGLALGPGVFARQSAALASRRDSTHLLPGIDCPALVLCGGEDSLCPIQIHQSMAAAMPRADLVVLSECGHLSPLEQPAAVGAALRNLLMRSP